MLLPRLGRAHSEITSSATVFHDSELMLLLHAEIIGAVSVLEEIYVALLSFDTRDAGTRISFSSGESGLFSISTTPENRHTESHTRAQPHSGITKSAPHMRLDDHIAAAH